MYNVIHAAPDSHAMAVMQNLSLDVLHLGEHNQGNKPAEGGVSSQDTKIAPAVAEIHVKGIQDVVTSISTTAPSLKFIGYETLEGIVDGRDPIQPLPKGRNFARDQH